MALDPSIILGVKAAQMDSPVDSYGKLLTLQTAQQNNQLNRMKMDEYERDKTQQSNLRQILQGSDPNNPDATAAAILKGGDLKAYGDFTKQQRENKKTDAETKEKMSLADKHATENAYLKISHVASVLDGVKSQVDLDRVREGLAANPLYKDAIANLPTVFDPAKISDLVAQGQDYKSKLENKIKADTLAQTKVRDANTATYQQGQNKASMITAGAHATQARNSGLQLVPDLGIVDKNSGKVTGFTDQAGAPLQTHQPLSTDAITNAAARYNVDGTLPPLGMGKDGAAMRKAILEQAATMAKTAGADGAPMSPTEQRVSQLSNKANSSALAKLQQAQTMVGAFEKNFTKNADLALAQSKLTDNSGVPIVTKWINSGKRSITGDPALSTFDVAVKATANEYAKIVSGSMGNTAIAESEIKKVEGLLNAAQTPQQVEAVINFMKKETANRLAGFEEEKKNLRGSMGGASPAGGTTLKFDSQGNPIK